MKKDKEFRIECDCGHRGHFFTIGEWGGDDKLHWSVVCEAGRDLPFWTRVNYAVNYILGRHQLNYIEIIWKREKLEKLGKFINNMLKDYKK